MNLRPNPKNLKIHYVGPAGMGHGHYRAKLSDKPKAAHKRQHKARLRRYIDCRVCCRCKYAFVSKGGSNVCSPCCHDAFEAYGRFTMTEPLGRLGYGVIRGWACRTGFFTYEMGNPTLNPRIPHPNLASIQPNLTSTLNHMGEDIGRRMLIYDSMPRVEGTMPLPWLYAVTKKRNNR